MFISMEQLSSNIDFLHLRQRSKRVPGFASSFFLQLLLLQTGYTVMSIFKIFGQQRQLFLGCGLTCDKFCFSAGDTVVVVVVAKHFSW